MNSWYIFFSNLPLYPGYFAILVLAGMFYLAFIGPIIFNFWVKPKIERRHNMYLKPKNPAIFYNYLAFAHLTVPLDEVSIYIFCKYIKCEPWFIKKPNEGTYYSQLKKMSYDINKATKAEIAVSVFTVIMMIATIISCAVFGFYLYSQK